MKQPFLWMALAAALWAGGATPRAAAQAAAEATTDTATDAAAGTATDATDAGAAASGTTSSATDATADAAGTTTSTAPSTAEATPSEPTPATGQASAGVGAQSDVQSSSTPSTGTDASVQAGAAAGAAPGQAPPTGQPTGQPQQPATQPPATQPPADASVGAAAGANLQGQAGVDARQLNVQQNLRTGLEFGQPTAGGLAVNAIAPNNFFYNSGIRRGDVLLSYAGRPIRTTADFWRWAVYQPGQRIPVVVLRDGRQETIYVTYHAGQQAGYTPAPSGAYLGVTFDQSVAGAAVIRTVNPGSPAQQAGLQPGDAIVGINGNRIGSAQDVIRHVASMQPGQAIDVAISRQVVLGARPGYGAQAAGYAPGVRVESYGVQPVAPASPAPPAAVLPADVDADVYVPAIVDDDVDIEGRVIRPGDADRDGRILDDDGRIDRIGRDRGTRRRTIVD